MDSELTIDELKEWLRIDDDSEDTTTLPSLISTSQLLIKQSTGVEFTDVQDNPDAINLYKTLQKFIITDLYENRAGSSFNPLIINLYSQLEAYKLEDDTDEPSQTEPPYQYFI